MQAFEKVFHHHIQYHYPNLKSIQKQVQVLELEHIEMADLMKKMKNIIKSMKMKKMMMMIPILDSNNYMKKMTEKTRKKVKY